MTEVERVYDAEVVQVGDAFYEACISEWSEGHAQALRGHLRCARAASKVELRYGESSLKEFAKDLRVGRTTVYEHAAWWSRAIERFGSEEAALERFASSPLSPWQAIEAMKGPPELLDRVEDENLPVRQIKRILSGEEEQNVETIELCNCPRCGLTFEMSEAVVWNEGSLR